MIWRHCDFRGILRLHSESVFEETEVFRKQHLDGLGRAGPILTGEATSKWCTSQQKL
jgi:hypothetical protein